MKNIATKLTKIILVISLSFTSIFNNITVQASETIKNLMDSNNVEKIYSTDFNTEEEATTARNNEITNQETIKTTKTEQGISYLYYVSNLEQFKKTVPTSKEDFKEIITEYESSKIIKTLEELKQNENTLIENYESLNDEHNIYTVTITLESNNPVKVDTKFNPTKYETLEEAVNATKGTNLEITKEYDEEDNVTITVNETCTNQAECNQKITDLENNENYTNVSVTIKKTESSTEETITLEEFETKTFTDDLESATTYANSLKSAILEYIKNNTKDTELQKINFTTVNLDNLDNILSSTTETVYQTTNVSGTYKNEETARLAAINYINELKETNSKIDVEESLENITINSNKVETVTVNQLFNTKQEAITYFENLKNNEQNYTLTNPTYKGIDQTTTSDSSSNTSGGTSTTAENWGHLDIDATNKINIMSSDGKTILDTVTGEVSLTKVTANGKTITYNNKSYDTNRNAWEFESNERNKLNIKSGDTVTITGTITYTYNNQEYTLNFTYTGKILTQNNTCQGSGDAKGYDLSISTINVTTDNKVIIEVATKYQLTYDKYNYTASINLATNKTTYTVTNPTITKKTTNVSYNLVGSYEEKGYDYIVNFPEDIMEDRYSFKAQISHLSKPETKEIDNWKYYVQTMEITAKGGDEDTKQEQPPKTGNETNYSNLFLLAVLVLIRKLVK